jgi:hypothetical protein
LQIGNRSGETLLDLEAENLNEFRDRIIGFPIARLPAGKDVKLNAIQASGDADYQKEAVPSAD